MIAKSLFVKTKFSSALTRRDLTSLRSRALRRGSWFRVLGKVERALVDLTIKVVDQVRSPVLYKALVSIVKKLESASDNRVSRAIRTVGFPCAQKLSLLAQKWGNKSAQNWMFDLSFARFIAIMHINSPALFPS
jgi:hypothetical protein